MLLERIDIDEEAMFRAQGIALIDAAIASVSDVTLPESELQDDINEVIDDLKHISKRLKLSLSIEVGKRQQQ